jgi:hypothetical protein
MLGDRGSGYQIGYEILNAVVRALDGRGPATSLVEAVLTKLNLSKACTPLSTNPRRSYLCRVCRCVCVCVVSCVSCVHNRARS